MDTLQNIVIKPLPAFSDTESKTAIEQTMNVHNKMNELVADYNRYINAINDLLSDWRTEHNEEMCEFKRKMERLTKEYGESVVTELNAVSKDVQTLDTRINTLEGGTVSMSYNSSTENLTLSYTT